MIAYKMYSMGQATSYPLAVTPTVYDIKGNADTPHEYGAPPMVNWQDVINLMAQKSKSANLEDTFSAFRKESHRAGSYGDETLRDEVLKRFNLYGLKTWMDKQYVKIQDPPASGYNRFVFKRDAEQQPTGFLSYSANGTVTGTVVYGHYGTEENFLLLQNEMRINMSGKVVLLRASENTFAEKVANAAKFGASAVLIYADPSDYSFEENTQLFGHVHLGSGDPYTPAFPSFNHTQFPPIKSSGLPKILAQTITAKMANNILKQLGGQDTPSKWVCAHKLGDENDNITLEVNNVLVEKKINNVFGFLEGLVDPDRFVVIGAHRDAWGYGFSASTVGTSILVELARSISEMVKHDRVKLRRSILFASWSAGEYGNVGATEWLETHLATLNQKAIVFINLDDVIQGYGEFKVSASPLLHALIQKTLQEVSSPASTGSLYSVYGKGNWESNILEPLKINDTAYPFLAFSGIPSMSFRFRGQRRTYYAGTMLDTQENLSLITGRQLPELTQLAMQFAGTIALRLVHDHLLQMDLNKYNGVIREQVLDINTKVSNLKKIKPKLFSEALSVKWLITAMGSYRRAMDKLTTDIQRSDLDITEKCRILNDRIMSVERHFLSPYVSPRDQPYRHILLGNGPHTLTALSEHLEHLRTNDPKADIDLFHEQFSLATWTIQGCANALAGNIWSFEKEI
ncbi:transferrin receptor protein 1-like isoform X2 [Cynoglossus semilaevis]|uniref:transferrin receptor protein 1-like isoform X2 n=1 Tax=Cynoglossus semilaevis TaxID=244447 RepID=UPI000D62817F|nr:transferrin receptor protein 1-like isoform X2 [Cynoglossus semilaevis]